jgi:hypothetical protein
MRTRDRHPWAQSEAWHRLACAGLLSLAGSAAVAATAWGSETRIGAPSYWPWLLTGLQVLALWAAGTKKWWGWLLGASVQPLWIAYALVTGQLGFIPGCAISAAVQTYSFARGSRLVGPVPLLNPAAKRLEEAAT